MPLLETGLWDFPIRTIHTSVPATISAIQLRMLATPAASNDLLAGVSLAEDRTAIHEYLGERELGAFCYARYRVVVADYETRIDLVGYVVQLIDAAEATLFRMYWSGEIV